MTGDDQTKIRILIKSGSISVRCHCNKKERFLETFSRDERFPNGQLCEGNVEVDCHSLSHRDANFTPLADDRDPPNAVSTPIHLSKHQALNI